MVDDDGEIAPPAGRYEDDYEHDWEPGKVLRVIDIQSGIFLQSVPFGSEGDVTAVHVDGDEIYIAGFNAEKVVVLQFAGSEA